MSVVRYLEQDFRISVGDLSALAPDISGPGGESLEGIAAVQFTAPQPAGVTAYLFVLEPQTVFGLARQLAGVLPDELRRQLVTELTGGIILPPGPVL